MRKFACANMHWAMLAAMVAICLTERGARDVRVQAASAQVIATLGCLAAPAMAVMHGRRLLLGRMSWRTA